MTNQRYYCVFISRDYAYSPVLHFTTFAGFLSDQVFEISGDFEHAIILSFEAL